MTNESHWINTLPSRADTFCRLFCLPFAGGGTVAFYPWRELLPEDVELVRIQLPGRETRLRETPYTRMEAMVSDLAEEMAPLLDRPIALFGHSMGALIAFELARELRRNYNTVPLHLFVSGRRAPHLPDRDSYIYSLPDEDFIRHLRQFQGMPEMVLENEELMALFLPILRADFELLSHYEYLEEPALECPITAFGGLSDPKISREDILAWRRHTAVRYESFFMEGGHFFLNQAKDQLVGFLNRAMHTPMLKN